MTLRYYIYIYIIYHALVKYVQRKPQYSQPDYLIPRVFVAIQSSCSGQFLLEVVSFFL